MFGGDVDTSEDDDDYDPEAGPPPPGSDDSGGGSDSDGGGGDAAATGRGEAAKPPKAKAGKRRLKRSRDSGEHPCAHWDLCPTPLYRCPDTFALITIRQKALAQAEHEAQPGFW